MTTRAKLREAAERVTFSGEWEALSDTDAPNNGKRIAWVVDEHGNVVADISNWPNEQASRNDAAFIALANPAAVLALIDEAEAAEARAAKGEEQRYILECANIRLARQRDSFRQDAINSERRRDEAEKKLRIACEALRSIGTFTEYDALEAIEKWSE